MKKTIVICLAAFLVLISSFTASAAEPERGPWVQCSADGCTLCDLFTTVQRIVGQIIKIFIPLIAVVLIAFGGFRMVFVQGDPDAANQAKVIITAAVVGLVIVYGGWAMVNTFMVSMGFAEDNGTIKGTDRMWYQIPCSQAQPQWNVVFSDKIGISGKGV
jgi:hypothetical protein